MSMMKLAVGLAVRSLRHPSLAVDLVKVSWRFRHRRWYLRPPFLPLPEREYVRWRMDTAYGSSDALPSVDDAERYVRWATRDG
jgi:hypothetical protein